MYSALGIIVSLLFSISATCLAQNDAMSFKPSTSSLFKRSQECTNSSFVDIEDIGTFQEQCGMGYASSNGQLLRITYVETFTDCMTACLNLVDEPAPCLGVSFFNGTNLTTTPVTGFLCWLLFDVSNPVVNTSDIAILQNQTSSGNLSKPIPCHNGETHQSVNSSELTIYCGTDYNQNDLYLTFARDIYSCADKCAEWNLNPLNVPCQGAVICMSAYGPAGPQGGSQCWLKFALTSTPNYSPGLNGNVTEVNSAVLTTPIVRSSNTPPTSSSCSVSDLSGGKIAGIVIGVVVALIVSFVAGVYCAGCFARKPDPAMSDEDERDTEPNPPASRVRSPTADVLPSWVRESKDRNSGGL